MSGKLAGLAFGLALMIGLGAFSPSAHAAIISIAGKTVLAGGSSCADVAMDSLKPAQPIEIKACDANPSQQFELSNTTIFAVGGQRCLDVFEAGSLPGTVVDSAKCNGTAAQVWYYYYGQLINPISSLCLDHGLSGTQLFVNTCSGAASQQWMIK